MKLAALMLFVATLACSGAGEPNYQDGLPADTVHIEGTVRTVVNDFAAEPGITWPAPAVTAGTGSFVIESTRYGSICLLDIYGYRSDGPMNIQVVIEPRGYTTCRPGRAIHYAATVSAVPGAYDINVIHEDRIAHTMDTVVKHQQIIVH